MVAESIVFESLTITVKCTIITGLEFKNMVQFVISAGDQFPSLLHCLPISTPERKLECNSEQGWVTSKFVLLLLQNRASEKSLAQAILRSKQNHTIAKHHQLLTYCMVGFLSGA